MKTKLLLTLLIGTTLVSCNHFFDHSDDDNPNPDINLTATNNLYEGDLYKLYLVAEIESTQTEFDSLQAVIDNNQGTQETIQLRDAAAAELVNLNTMSIIQDAAEASAQVVPRVPVPRPVPPLPCTSGACIPNVLEHITITPDIRSLFIEFKNPQTLEVIASATIDQFSPLPQYNNLVSAVPINFNGYTGSVLITVERTFADQNATVVPYTLTAAIF